MYFTQKAIEAIKNNNTECLKFTIKNGADINQLTVTSIRENNIEVLKFLIENGADVNVVDEEHKISPLDYTFYESESTDFTKILFEAGATMEKESIVSILGDISLDKDNEFYPYFVKLFEKLVPEEALIIAAKYKRCDLIDVIIQKYFDKSCKSCKSCKGFYNFNYNYVDENGMSLLAHAITARDSNLVVNLVDNGADVNFGNDQGLSLFYYFLESGDKFKLFR